jgi:hypothetical protein
MAVSSTCSHQRAAPDDRHIAGRRVGETVPGDDSQATGEGDRDPLDRLQDAADRSAYGDRLYKHCAECLGLPRAHLIRVRDGGGRSAAPRGSRRGPFAQVASGDLDIPIRGQLPPAQLPLGDALEPGPLEVVRLDTLLRGCAAQPPGGEIPKRQHIYDDSGRKLEALYRSIWPPRLPTNEQTWPVILSIFPLPANHCSSGLRRCHHWSSSPTL